MYTGLLILVIAAGSFFVLAMLLLNSMDGVVLSPHLRYMVIIILSLIALAVCSTVFVKEAVANSDECYYDSLYGDICDEDDLEAAVKKHRMLERGWRYNGMYN